MTPAFASSSLNLPIAVRICSLGIIPASDSLLALTKIINRIFVPPLAFFCGADGPTVLRYQPGSAYLSNERSPNRPLKAAAHKIPVWRDNHQLLADPIGQCAE